MFKRRDWVHLHGQEGDDSSDDESSGQLPLLVQGRRDNIYIASSEPNLRKLQGRLS